jgi:hypothetical protein
MAISYPLATPTNKTIQQVSFFARNTVAMSMSPFTYAQQVYKWKGQRWEADITLPPMLRANAEEWISFLVSLKGSYGTFLLGDPSAVTPRGTASVSAGTPVINGASQTGDQLIIDGATTSQTGYLKAGDYIQLGSGVASRLHKVLQDVNTDGSGNATLTIFPDIRTSPSDNSTVVVTSAKGVFRLNENVVNWNVNEASIYGITFGAIEGL